MGWIEACQVTTAGGGSTEDEQKNDIYRQHGSGCGDEKCKEEPSGLASGPVLVFKKIHVAGGGVRILFRNDGDE